MNSTEVVFQETGTSNVFKPMSQNRFYVGFVFLYVYFLVHLCCTILFGLLSTGLYMFVILVFNGYFFGQFPVLK